MSVTTRIILCLLSSALMMFCFFPVDQGWLAWIALVPLIIACSGWGVKERFLLGFVSGTVAMVGIYYWIFQVPGFRWYHEALLAPVYGVIPALWCAGTKPHAKLKIPVILMAPALWTALDYLKSHAGFLSLPWASIAHSQHDNLYLLQLASWTGEYGITFIIVMANTAIAHLLSQRKTRNLAITAAMVFLLHIWGASQLVHTGDEETIRLMVVQPSISADEIKSAEGRAASFVRLAQLTQSKSADGLELVIWPETAVRDLSKHEELLERIKKLSGEVGAPIITGSSDFRKFPSNKTIDSKNLTFKLQAYNSAYFVTESEPLPKPYRKIILVPFGEYLPVEELVAWPRWFIPEMLKIMPGEDYRFFPLTDKIRISPIICWENLFADHVRKLARHQPQLIVQLTNDYWFGATAAPYQHNVASIFRAVENRTPIAISSNTGPSQIINAYGKVVTTIDTLFSPGVTLGDVQIIDDRTFYTQQGDIFTFGCLFLVIFNLANYILTHSLLRHHQKSLNIKRSLTNINIEIVGAGSGAVSDQAKSQKLKQKK